MACSSWSVLPLVRVGRRAVWSLVRAVPGWSLFGALCGPGCVPPLVFAVFTWLGYVNSTMNPVIYSIYHLLTYLLTYMITYTGVNRDLGHGDQYRAYKWLPSFAADV